MVLPDPSKFVSRVRFSHAAPPNWKKQHDNWERRNLFGMCNFIELWYHGTDRCSIIDQQPVASLLERPALESARKHAICALCWSWQNSRTLFRQEIILRLVKWYHSWFGTKERKFDSCIGDHVMQRWQSGPMHGIANPENHWFKSSPLLQNRKCPCGNMSWPFLLCFSQISFTPTTCEQYKMNVWWLPVCGLW